MPDRPNRRRPMRVVALLAILALAACSAPAPADLNALAAPITISIPAGTLSGDAVATVSTSPTPDEVRFYVDDPALSGPPALVDVTEPFRIVIDTTLLTDGTHTLTVVTSTQKGRKEKVEVAHAQFTVSNTPPPEPDPDPPPAVGDVTVTQTPSGYAVDGITYERGYEAINAAIGSLSSGTVLIGAGTYDVGASRVLADDGQWISAHPSTSVTNGVSGFADGYGSSITVSSNPGSGTLVAYLNLPDPALRSEIATMGFWALPNQVFSDRGMNSNANGGPFDVVLDDTPGCASPQFQQELVHPEWVTDEWKWYTLSGGIGVGRVLPSSLGTVRCVGIVWKDAYAGASSRPGLPHALTVDDIEGTVDGSWVSTKSGVNLVGEGAGVTILRASYGLNFPMVSLYGSNIEISGMELDGNYFQQQAIDYAPGIHNGSGSSNSLHHLHIHHVRGEGIKIRGQQVSIFENVIEWTENAQINTTASASDVHIHHNTLRYGTNDGNLWLFGGTGIVMEHNDLHDITQEAIGSDPTPLITQSGDWVPFTAKDSASGWVFRFNRIHGGNYGIQLSSTGQGVIENNVIAGTTKQGIVMWGGGVTSIELTRNIVEDGGGTGIQTGGAGHALNENWTRGNSFGMDLSRASSQSGVGNYAPDGFTSTPGVSFGSAAPTIDEGFSAGASWVP